MKRKKGFTLIELLVVVLIIGILAAIALPQYRKAVAKSRMAQALTNINTLNQANERYYMINSQYANDINKLDVVFGETATNPYETSMILQKAGNYLYGAISSGENLVYYPAQGQLQFFISKFGQYADNGYKQYMICTAYGNSQTIYDDICKSMGGVYVGTGSANGLPKRWYRI